MQLVSEKEMYANYPYEEVDIKSENPKSMFELAKNLAVFARDNEGIGLAAPQVGVWRKVMVFLDSEANYVMAINPKYVPKGSRAKTKEGCLTVPNKEAEIKRYKRIKARFWTFDEEGKPKFVEWTLMGHSAVIYQHEVDHLEGRLLGRDIAEWV